MPHTTGFSTAFRKLRNAETNPHSDLGLFPIGLADESGQRTAVGGLPAEGIAFIARLAVGDFFLHVGSHFALGLHIIELMFHSAGPP